MKLYQHFKGGFYVLLCEALHSETQEPMVVYQSCETGKIWVRPKVMFFGNVTRGSYSGPRFNYIGKTLQFSQA